MPENNASKKEKDSLLEQCADIVPEKYQKFLAHKCPIKYDGAIGGKWTYEFTPTSIGTVCKVRCACGYSDDLSDYNSW